MASERADSVHSRLWSREAARASAWPMAAAAPASLAQPAGARVERKDPVLQLSGSAFRALLWTWEVQTQSWAATAAPHTAPAGEAQRLKERPQLSYALPLWGAKRLGIRIFKSNCVDSFCGQKVASSPKLLGGQDLRSQTHKKTNLPTTEGLRGAPSLVQPWESAIWPAPDAPRQPWGTTPTAAGPGVSSFEKREVMCVCVQSPMGGGYRKPQWHPGTQTGAGKT